MKHWRPRILGRRRAAALAGRRRAGRRAWCSLRTTRHSRSRATASDWSGRSADRAELRFVESWHDPRLFVGVLAERVSEAHDAHVVFTAHSLPERILADGRPVSATSCSRPRGSWRSAPGIEDWSFAFQSASTDRRALARPGHPRGARRNSTPGASGRSSSCPVGFVSDHLEILWDLDVEARERAAQLGLELDRIESLNDDPAFIRALAGVAHKAWARGNADHRRPCRLGRCGRFSTLG